MKIIHIATMSPFFQYSAELFEELSPNTNTYLISNYGGSDNAKKIQNIDAPVVSITGILGLKKIIRYVKSCDVVIVHGMSFYGVIAFTFGPSRVKKVWSGWGYDYYGNGLDPNAGLVSEKTIALMRNVNKYFSQEILFTKAKEILIAAGARLAAARCDFFSAPIPDDFEIFRKRFSKFNGKYTQLNYGDVYATFSSMPTSDKDLNILIGNSATETNNHIDVFYLLANSDLSGRKIIVPLSYGNLSYREKIIKIGEKLFGEKFFPLTEYMPLEQYNNLISSCNIVIMNHYRQQAIGNIGSALFSGAHLYLNGKNPTYNFFKSRGAIFRSVNDIVFSPLPSSRLAMAELNINRKIIEEFWGYEKVRANVKSLLMQICDVY